MTRSPPIHWRERSLLDRGHRRRPPVAGCELRRLRSAGRRGPHLPGHDRLCTHGRHHRTRRRDSWLRRDSRRHRARESGSSMDGGEAGWVCLEAGGRGCRQERARNGGGRNRLEHMTDGVRRAGRRRCEGRRHGGLRVRTDRPEHRQKLSARHCWRSDIVLRRQMQRLARPGPRGRLCARLRRRGRTRRGHRPFRRRRRYGGGSPRQRSIFGRCDAWPNLWRPQARRSAPPAEERRSIFAGGGSGDGCRHGHRRRCARSSVAGRLTTFVGIDLLQHTDEPVDPVGQRGMVGVGVARVATRLELPLEDLTQRARIRDASRPTPKQCENLTWIRWTPRRIRICAAGVDVPEVLVDLQ